jgi:hypothetical protein
MDLLHRNDSSSSSEEEENELQGEGEEPAGAAADVAIQDVVDDVPARGTHQHEIFATASTTTTTTCRSRRRRRKRGIVTVSSSTENESGSVTTKRIRQQAHVDGNWAGLCYLPIRVVRNTNGAQYDHDDDTTAALLRLDHRLRLAKLLCETLAATGYSGHCHIHQEDDPLPLHISLSRPFYLQQSNLQPFVRALSDELRSSSSLLFWDDDNDQTRQPSRPPPQRCGRGGPFQVTIDAHEVVLLTNDDATRSFIAWKVHEEDHDEMAAGGAGGGGEAQQRLERLTNCCNRVLCSYQQPVFYDQPQFHISWASFVPAIPPDTIRQTMLLMKNKRRRRRRRSIDATVEDCCSSADINEHDDDDDDEEEHSIDVTITHLCVKFGTVKLFEIPL